MSETTIVTRRRLIAMLAAAPVAALALPSVVAAAPVRRPMPAAWPEPSPLVGAILDRQLAHMRTICALVAAGASKAEFDRAGDEVNARIRAELVEPHGEAGYAAANEAADRMLAFVHALGEHWGVDLDAEDA